MTEIFAIQLIAGAEFESIREQITALLPMEIKNKILQYKNNAATQRSLLGEILSRSVLSKKLSIPLQDISIKKAEKGKPFLKDHPLYFNISHSGDWVVVATSEKEIGVDIELIRKVDFRIAERYFSEKEKKTLFSLSEEKQTAYFFDLWTLKESYLKLLGKGLTKSLSTFTITGDHGNFQLSYDQQIKHEAFFKQYQIDQEYKTSVCAYSKDFCENIQFIKIDELARQSHTK